MKSPTLIKTGIALCAVVATGLLLYPVATVTAATPSTDAATKPAAQPKARKRKASKQKAKPSTLDLSVRTQPAEPVISPENPDYASTVLRQRAVDPAVTASAEETSYKTEPLFQSEQKLQLLDAEVPVTVKLGRWKAAESKALGLSATVPLPHPAK
ncbi:hypothetical protein [Nevskia ramosa]|uniref:hypothetical protein n=1 Tax=Nevskia ramosa TaxID=64002 RepID=UPI0003B593E1|nr:hypothetical protein [Nevskia ramosa]